MDNKEDLGKFGIDGKQMKIADKAGLRFVILPKESISIEGLGYAIDTKCLIDNWAEWGYFDCPINEIMKIETREY